MDVDPRKPIVQVMARLGRETQLHLDERHRHFKVTDKVIMIISLLLVLLAFVNVYYVTVLYQDLNGIVGNGLLSRFRTFFDSRGGRLILPSAPACFTRHAQPA